MLFGTVQFCHQSQFNPFMTEAVIIEKPGFYMITASIMKGLNSYDLYEILDMKIYFYK